MISYQLIKINKLTCQIFSTVFVTIDYVVGDYPINTHVCLFFFGWNNIGYYLSWILIDSHPQLLGPFSDGVRLTLFCFFDKINYCLHYFGGFHRSLLVVLLTIHVFIFFHKWECKRVGGILKDLNLCQCSQSLNHMLEELTGRSTFM